MSRIAPLVFAVCVAAAGCSLGEAVTESTIGATLPPVGPIVLEPGGLGVVDIGAVPEEVVAALTPLIGSPDHDTGWIAGGEGIYGTCPAELLVISWGSLATFFTGGPGAPVWFAWSYGFDYIEALPGSDPRNLALTTADGIGLTTTVADLADAGIEVTGDADVGVWRFVTTPDGSGGAGLDGQVAGPAPTDTVQLLETNEGCA